MLQLRKRSENSTLELLLYTFNYWIVA